MSTLKVTNIEHESTGNGGIQLDNAGHVTVDGQQLPTAGALSNRNLVVNGALIVAQRSTSVTGVANSANEGYQTLDRFGLQFANNAGGVCTVSQSTDAPTNQGFKSSYKIDVTTADTSIATNQQIYTSTIFEARDIRNSGWNYTDPSSYLTLSFWVKSSKAGTYCITMRDFDAGAWYYVFEYTLVADTWTKVTHSIPGHASLVFNDDVEHGLDIRWILVTGTDRDSHTGGSWLQNGTAVATPNQVNFFDSTSNDFYLTGVQLEVGEKATPFEHRSYGDELARCQRYFQIVRGSIRNDYRSDQVARFGGSMNFFTEMRAGPLISTRTTVVSQNITQPTFDAVSSRGCMLSAVGSITTGGTTAQQLVVEADCTAEL